MTLLNIKNKIDIVNDSFLESSINNLSDMFNNSYESKITRFHNELLKISIFYGLGDNISIQCIYDGPSFERLFTIHTSRNITKKEKYSYLEKIINHMDRFSREYGLFDFFKDAYIQIK